MNLFMQKSKQTEQKEEKIPFQGLNLIKKEQGKNVQQKKVVEQISQINILKEEMLNEAKSFHENLDQLEHQLIKKSNELQILTSQQMNEISQKNISLVKQFIKYQQSLIRKLEGKTSNWDHLQTQLHEVELKVNKQMDQNDLPVKLAKIEILEEEIQNLMNEIEQLNEQHEGRKW